MFGIRLRPRIDRIQLARPDAPDPVARESYPIEVDGRIQALETALEALQGRFALMETGRTERFLYAQDTRATVDAHSARFEELIFAVSEGISKVERAEARIRATIRRARAELEEGGTYSPALDAEHAELRILDGGRGGEEPVQPLQQDVETPDVSDIPGDWSPEDLALIRGA